MRGGDAVFDNARGGEWRPGLFTSAANTAKMDAVRMKSHRQEDTEREGLTSASSLGVFLTREA